jgi:hypothetical protein
MTTDSTPAKVKSKRNKYGKPFKTIDWIKVDKWIAEGARGTTIAERLGVYPDTLYLACERENGTTYTAYSQQKRSIGDDNILKSQYEVAIEDKNVTMLIWLGKQRCGQKETQDSQGLSPEVLEHYKSFMDWVAKKQAEATQSSALKQACISDSTETTS